MILSDSEIKKRMDQMMLVDWQIRRWLDNGLVIDPIVDDDCFQPMSVDLRLSSEVRLYKYADQPLDLRDPQDLTSAKTIPTGGLIVPSGAFLLGSTIERVELPGQLVGRVEGQSRLGRSGLAIHITAGLIDGGFRGNITLELKNMNTVPLVLYTGMKICQITFDEVAMPDRIYGDAALKSHFQNSRGTVGVRGSET